MGKQAGIQYTIYTHHQQLQKLLTVLGGKVYHLIQEGTETFESSNPVIKNLVAKIEDLEKKINDLEQKAKALK